MTNTEKDSTKVYCLSITICVSFERGDKVLNSRGLDNLGWRVKKRESETGSRGNVEMTRAIHSGTSQKPRPPKPRTGHPESSKGRRPGHPPGIPSS